MQGNEKQEIQDKGYPSAGRQENAVKNEHT